MIRLWRSVVLVAVMLIGGCARKLTVTQTTVAEILREPRRFTGAVLVRGKVKTAYGVLSRGVYVVDDKTGEIPVVTTHNLPDPGDEVAVQGQVGTLVQANDHRVTVILEKGS
jgi:hypothetical protein